MYNKRKGIKSTKLLVNNSNEGETIERKFERILENKEPITDGAAIIYTDRNEGVGAGYNIRTDRFEIALDGISSIQKSASARREERAKMEIVKENDNGEAEPIQGTNNK